MHPDLPPHISATFIQSYFSDAMIDLMKALLGDDEEEDVMADELVMELYNMLVRPDRDFELRWHRDTLKPDATDEEEMTVLGKRQWHTQWNTALYDDSSLIVVPGSHRRARTAHEKGADPYAKNIDGMKAVELKAGDVVFYNKNILHMGVYNAKKERATLHGSVGLVDGGNNRARNILQHGIGDWAEDINFDCLEGPAKDRAEVMLDNLLDIGSGNEDVSYAQED